MSKKTESERPCDWCGGRILKIEEENGGAIWKCEDCGWLFGLVIPVLVIPVGPPFEIELPIIESRDAEKTD